MLCILVDIRYRRRAFTTCIKRRTAQIGNMLQNRCLSVCRSGRFNSRRRCVVTTGNAFSALLAERAAKPLFSPGTFPKKTTAPHRHGSLPVQIFLAEFANSRCNPCLLVEDYPAPRIRSSSLEVPVMLPGHAHRCPDIK